jgi:hypothetical protein
LQAELESDPEYQDHDDGWYIADSFALVNLCFETYRQGRYWRKEFQHQTTRRQYQEEDKKMSILVRSLAGLPLAHGSRLSYQSNLVEQVRESQLSLLKID